MICSRWHAGVATYASVKIGTDASRSSACQCRFTVSTQLCDNTCGEDNSMVTVTTLMATDVAKRWSVIVVKVVARLQLPRPVMRLAARLRVYG
jgi:hypothetical protein